MNHRQKLVQQQFLNNEEAVIKRLNQVYRKSLSDVQDKIKNLQFDIGRLQAEYDWMDPKDPDKEKVKSQIQSKIYQKKYQEQLQRQLDGILKQMQRDQYLTVSGYLDNCYTDGFIGSIFDLSGQGCPLMMPINQESMVHAVQLDSKISKGLYTRLGEDVDLLKKKITAQVSRSIATGETYTQTAKQLANYSNIGYNNAIRIARTEGHRIQTTAQMDAMHGAKDRGADLVKQWDAALDARTRDSHVKVDGEWKEIDEKFSNGLRYPGDPHGAAAEVINCRCALLQRARWALADGFTKMDGFTGEIKSFDSTETYNEFKEAYFSPENKAYMKYVGELEEQYGTKDFNTILGKMTDDEYTVFKALEKARPQFSGMYRGDDIVVSKVVPPASVDDLAEEIAEEVIEKVTYTADIFPSAFKQSASGRRNKVGENATKVFADKLTNAEGVNPNVVKLYTNIDKMPNAIGDFRVSYVKDGHQLTTDLNPWSGKVVGAKLNIPKMDVEDLTGQLQTAFHEMGHLIDLGYGNEYGSFTETYSKLANAIKSSGDKIPDEMKAMFKDYKSKYEEIYTKTSAKYKAERKQLGDDLHAKKITYAEYSKAWDKSVREQDADIDYQTRNLYGGVNALEDIYDALSGGWAREMHDVTFGHGTAYYSTPGNRASEIFANYMSLSVNRPDLVEVLRKDKPDLCNALDEIIEEMAGKIQ